MLSAIFTFLFRNVIRNFSYAAITLSSLVVGITTAILLFLWIRYEMNYNRAMPDAERIYTLLMHDIVDGEIITEEGATAQLWEFLNESVPDAESITRIDNTASIVANGDKSVQMAGVFADDTFFSVFPPNITAGTIPKSFSTGRQVAISTELAQTIFGSENALGKTISFDRRSEFIVTAVYQPFPQTTDFRDISFVLPYHGKVRERDEITNYYLKLFKGASREDAEARVDKKFASLYGNNNTTTLLFSVKDWRLRWNFENGKQTGGRIVYLIIFGISGLLVLVMACINYMNIATARATRRSREVGVRKMTGATQRVLILQFLTESLIISFAAAGFSLLAAYILLPLFNLLIGLPLIISLSDPMLWIGLFLIALFTGLLAGSYPAFLLSSFKPAIVLKGSLYSGVGGAGIRKALVVFQISLSAIIIFCALVTWKQTTFLLQKDVGYDKHRVLNVWLSEDVNYEFGSLKSQVMAHTAVESVAFGGCSPMEVNGYNDCNRVEAPFESPLLFYGANIDESVIPTLKFEVVSGRNFLSSLPTDSNNFVITQRAADLLGFPDPVGQRITYGMFGQQEGEIVGVLRDFQNDDIHTTVKPVVFVLGKQRYLRNMFVRYREGKLDDAIAHVKAVLETVQPGIPVSYSFLDEDFDRQLYRERLMGNIAIWFMGISVTVACLGLFGLILFNAQRRTKEIGIRKVLGASAAQMTVMLCRDFVSPVVYSLVIAFPVAYWLMEEFLSGYYSRVEVSVDTFGLVAAATAALVLVTISWQALKAALQNPVETLKVE